ncbi:putative cytosolic iron-sulfur protein assembly protein 1 [Exophiala dermatitidis]
MTEPLPPRTTGTPQAPATTSELSLLRILHSPAPGPSRSWQSTPHPDPSTPLLATASADKTVNIWSLRDFSLISTISGGHKRSVRTVAWKDFGRSSSKQQKKQNSKPVVLGTGSFDANVGIWIWNDDRRWARFRREQEATTAESGGRGGGDDVEVDMTREREGEGDGDDDEDEEWHFSTLLTGPDSEIKSIDFSPPHYSANLLATCSRDKSVWIWEEVEPEEWETIAVLSEHTGDVKCVSWCTGAVARRKRRKVVDSTIEGDVAMTNNNGHGEDDTGRNGNNLATNEEQEDEDQDEVIIGSREILASGSYDDTIRLWRDVEEEGDWICVAVIDGHSGTVWDLKWEGYINYAQLDLSSLSSQQQQEDVVIADFEADWSSRLVSCSDDLTVRVWRRELSEAEQAKRRAQQSQGVAQTGFASTRLPSVIRPQSSMERWVQDAALPQVHVRSVYAVDWSRRSGLVVSCGGDGTIAVYKEVRDVADDTNDTDVGATTAAATATNDGQQQQQRQQQNTDDVVMLNNGESGQSHDESCPYKLHKMKWILVALMEGAHDEYEINHVCWALRRDKDRRFDEEEVIVSTGDEGDVRVWTLPDDLARDVQRDL